MRRIARGGHTAQAGIVVAGEQVAENQGEDRRRRGRGGGMTLTLV